MGSVRAPFRGNRRARAAGRANARRAIRIFAGDVVADRGCAFAGCVQDFIILFCSIRRDGKTLGEMARDEVSKRGGFIAQLAVLAIMVILLGVVALVIVNALKSSPWATFTLAMTIPIALAAGFVFAIICARARSGSFAVIGVALVLFAVVAGQWVAESPSWAHVFTFSGVALAFLSDGLRICRIGAAGLAAARAARLFERVHQEPARFFLLLREF